MIWAKASPTTWFKVNLNNNNNNNNNNNKLILNLGINL